VFSPNSGTVYQARKEVARRVCYTPLHYFNEKNVTANKNGTKNSNRTKHDSTSPNCSSETLEISFFS
jgi:hypothetical protein